MPRPTSRERDPISIAVARLRQSFGESQQEFANRTGLAITTVARYETSRPPQGESLDLFCALARQQGLTEVAETFRNALIAQTGVTGKFTQLGALASYTIPGIYADLLLLVHDLEYGNGTPKSKIGNAIRTLKTVLPNVEKLNLYLPKPAPETLQKDLSISGQGTVRRDDLHLPGGGTRLIEVTVTDGSPPAASEEPQGTAEGEERSAPK